MDLFSKSLLKRKYFPRLSWRVTGGLRHGPFGCFFSATKPSGRSLFVFKVFLHILFSTLIASAQMPLNTLISSQQSPSLQSKMFLKDDPALVVLYKQLREKSLQTLRGAIMVPPKVETEFVIQTARLYDRMGCDLLALDLGM